MLYLDTSLLVANLGREDNSELIDEWLAAQTGDELAISDWVITEFSSALSVKLRTKQIEAVERPRILKALNILCASSFTVLPIHRNHFHEAARLADRSTLGLRGADALHLAICISERATLCTLDKRLGAAGQALAVMMVTL